MGCPEVHKAQSGELVKTIQISPKAIMSGQKSKQVHYSTPGESGIQKVPQRTLQSIILEK